eukprot:TsM_001171300 transcript=TsM_001171300 gene=TsM_001171300
MIFKFCLISLATCVVAKNYIAVKEFKVDVAGAEMVSLPKHFYWGYVDPESIELLWDVDELGECYADRIQMTAVTDAPFPLVRMESVQFPRGELTLGDLRPSTTYNVTVEALRGVDTIFNCTQVVITPPAEHEEGDFATDEPLATIE